MEVRYSVNDKYFKDSNVCVSDSDGLFDALQRKKINTYDWAEYHGSAPDLSLVKFEQREIILKCFVIGDNWIQMKSNFDTIISEFQKTGTQRLLIEPFDMKALSYEVYLADDVKLEKTFKDGVMAGVFSLKLIEPNPLKKVFKTDLDIVDLSYLSQYETEIFWGDGTKNIFSGNVTQTKDFHFPSYQSSGYSVVYQSAENPLYYQSEVFLSATKYYEFSVNVNNIANATLYVIGRKKNTNAYEVISESEEQLSAVSKLKVIALADLSKYGKIFFKVLAIGNEIPGLVMTNPRIERTEILGEWKNMIGKTKYIIVAGNIEEISSLTTNAEELWIKL